MQIAGLEEQVSSAMRAKADAQIQSEEAASLQNQLQHKSVIWYLSSLFSRASVSLYHLFICKLRSFCFYGVQGNIIQ